MSQGQEKHFLLWKGKQSGPFALEEIETKLLAGEISRIHQISVNGNWQVLDDFLQRFRKPRASLRRPAEPPSSDDRSPLARLLPKPPPSAPALPTSGPGTLDLSFPAPDRAGRTSAFAIVALIAALCTLVPYVDFVSWIPALVFGHMALVQMHRDATLRGRGMAIASLFITYFLLILGLTFLGLMLINHQKLPF
jgi:Domain of unknown function (DUF4190)